MAGTGAILHLVSAALITAHFQIVFLETMLDVMSGLGS